MDWGSAKSTNPSEYRLNLKVATVTSFPFHHEIHSTDLTDEQWEDIEKAWAEPAQDEWLERSKLLHKKIIHVDKS